MASNSFGDTFRVTTWGESHGPALGCTIDGVPPQIPFSEADIQPELDRRKPGQSRYTTQRREGDDVQILSGVFEGLTTGAPISLVIYNADQRSKDYSDIKDLFRPGHADYTYWAKYGHRDYRGGGRQSARETAMRVAAGALARKILAGRFGAGACIRGALVQMGGIDIDRANWDWDAVSQNAFFSPDPAIVDRWAGELDRLRKAGSSAGAVVEVVAEGLPPGLGEPIYDKLDGDLARAMMTINAVKGVEIGNGFEAAATSGVDNADEMRLDASGQPYFLSNNNGGTLGGISTGQPLHCRFAVKPTSSILTEKRTIDKFGNETTVSTKGRHDPCVGIRAVPVGEAMMALVLADHALRARASAALEG